MLINEENLNEFKSQEGNKLVVFSAKWCGPCKMLSPILDELETEGFKIGKVDVDENADLSMDYGVRSVPTICKVNGDGEVAAKLIGAQPKHKLVELLQND